MIAKRKKLVILLGMILCIVALAGLVFAMRQRQTTSSRAALPEGADIPIVKEEGQLVPGFPADFPVYPDATIEESSQRTQTINTGNDFHAVWTTKEPVKPVMQWYIAELQKNEWAVEPPNDPEAQGEQVAQIKKGDLAGYIAVEDEGNSITEIVVDFKKTSSSL